MSDLIELLREWDGVNTAVPASMLLKPAADEIERLTAQVKNMREEYIERQEWGAEQAMAVIKELKDRVKVLEPVLEAARPFELTWTNFNSNKELKEAIAAADREDEL